MLKGDACWATTKRILGWDLDTVAETINLPPHRLERLHELLDSISPPHKRVSIQRWHQLLGKLRSMSPTLPGARGLFSVLQESLRRADRNRVRITREVWHMAADFRAIADSLHTRPTRIQELIPGEPSFIGACDACGTGMGGVWFPNSTATDTRPMLWRMRYPAEVQSALETADRPHGTLSILDLALAALIAHKDVLSHLHPIAERTIWTATDNRGALSWSIKGSATSTAARAYLLRLNSLHQRHHHYIAVHNHIAGKANVMADDASRRWDLDDAALLPHFACRYPQDSPWRLCSLSSDTNLALIGALFKRRPAHESLTSAPPPPTHPGASGAPSARASLWTPTIFRETPFLSSSSLSRASALVPSLPVVTPYELARWKMPCERWARRMSPDPRLNSHGHLDFRLTALYRSWSKVDDPPSRVKPLPGTLLAQTVQLAHQEGTPVANAAGAVLILGHFFLLRPGEYMGTPNDTLDTLFRLRDLTLWVGSRSLDHLHCPIPDLHAATFATLTFTRQKNGVRNETIGHGRSGHPRLCPVLCLVDRIIYLRSVAAVPATPINAYKPPGTLPFRYIQAADLTRRIRAALAIHPHPG